MKFRPLCIDYHARAQEIVATERDSHARRTALRTLPNPSPRHRPNSRCEDGIGLDRGDASSEYCGKENQNGSVSTGNDGDGDELRGIPDENGRPADETAVQSNERGDSLERPTETAAGTNGGVENSRRRIQSIMKMLGPAVHPSECAFRSIAPVTKGPVRGRKLPVATLKPLEGMTEIHPDHVEKKRNAVIGSMESGRSRFNSSSNGVFAFLSKDSFHNGRDKTHRGSKDTTFVDTMKIVYARSRSSHNSEDSYLDRDPEKEIALKTQIWSQHVKNLPMPESLYLKHEPEDLTKIYRLKSLRSSATTTFANEISRTFRPKIGALKSDSHCQRTKTRNGLALVGSTNCNLGKIPTKPKIDFISCGISESRKKKDYTLRLNSVPFTQFLDDNHDVGANEDG
mmetsp:Transcript_44019/g.79003  ORF Transcript_44019/g.79003 Transcript_44019/m.79003 type:complete len:399 (+) Transcript_44019:73-1269(+)